MYFFLARDFSLDKAETMLRRVRYFLVIFSNVIFMLFQTFVVMSKKFHKISLQNMKNVSTYPDEGFFAH